MARQVGFDKIRPIVEAIADLICCHGFSVEDDGLIRAHLLGLGFDLDQVRAAEDWCDIAQSTGSLLDVLSLFVPAGTGVRVFNPLERVAVSDEVWSVIEKCRSRGIITLDMAERLLEGARAMDTRDWSDEDVIAFLSDACSASTLPSSQPRIERALQGDFRNYLS